MIMMMHALQLLPPLMLMLFVPSSTLAFAFPLREFMAGQVPTSLAAISRGGNKENEGPKGAAVATSLSRRAFLKLVTTSVAMITMETTAHTASAAAAPTEKELNEIEYTKRNVEAAERSSSAYEMANEIAKLAAKNGERANEIAAQAAKNGEGANNVAAVSVIVTAVGGVAVGFTMNEKWQEEFKRADIKDTKMDRKWEEETRRADFKWKQDTLLAEIRDLRAQIRDTEDRIERLESSLRPWSRNGKKKATIAKLEQEVEDLRTLLTNALEKKKQLEQTGFSTENTLAESSEKANQQEQPGSSKEIVAK